MSCALARPTVCTAAANLRHFIVSHAFSTVILCVNCVAGTINVECVFPQLWVITDALLRIGVLNGDCLRNICFEMGFFHEIGKYFINSC
jgi:hypothetical protein